MAGSRAQTRDGDAYVRCLWAALAERMEEWRSDWRATIDGSDADADITVVIGPPARSDREIFEAFAVEMQFHFRAALTTARIDEVENGGESAGGC